MGADAAPHDLFAERPAHRVGELPYTLLHCLRCSASLAVVVITRIAMGRWRLRHLLQRNGLSADVCLMYHNVWQVWWTIGRSAARRG
jgi:hypothetical protein